MFVGTSVAGTAYHWPYSVEPVTVGLDEEWKMGTDIEVGTVKESLRTIPLLNFEYNGISYTTYGNTDLPANLVFLDKKNALMSTNGGRTFQKFYTKSSSDTIYALYAVVESNDVYYATEELYSEDHYKFTFEQEEDKAIITYHPDILSFAFNWFALSFVVGIIAFLLILFWINRNEEA